MIDGVYLLDMVVRARVNRGTKVDPVCRGHASSYDVAPLHDVNDWDLATSEVA
jgi:hypothetical protein